MITHSPHRIVHCSVSVYIRPDEKFPLFNGQVREKDEWLCIELGEVWRIQRARRALALRVARVRPDKPVNIAVRSVCGGTVGPQISKVGPPHEGVNKRTCFDTSLFRETTHNGIVILSRIFFFHSKFPFCVCIIIIIIIPRQCAIVNTRTRRNIIITLVDHEARHGCM